jgi:Ca2+-binding EF-hand superfamily protein
MKKLLTIVAVSFISAAAPAFANTNHDGMKDWVDRLFKEADTDGNGTISKDEFMAYSEKKFDAMDTNNDGELTKAEVLAFKKNEMKEHHAKHARANSSNDETSANANDRNEATKDDQERVDTSSDTKSNSRRGSDNGQ